jgi:hypothetical protein
MKPGEPKKGGGGGMFTWGRADDTANNYRTIVEDKNDPNYASESSFEVQSGNNSVHQSPAKSFLVGSSSVQVTPDHFHFDELDLKKETRTKVDQVFTEVTYSSFISWIRSLNRAKLHSFIFARTLQVSLEKTDSEYEVAFGLIDLLHSAKLFTSREIRRGFDRLYRLMPELLTDVPNSPETVLSLLSKLIIKGVLSPSSVLRVPLQVFNLGRGSYVLREVKQGDLVLADLVESLPTIKENVLQLLKEYLATGVSDGVADFLRNNKWLGSLVVRKAVELALDRRNFEKELCSRLLAEISGCCGPEALVEGFDDLLWNSHELFIDVPGTADLVSKFIARAVVDDSLPANYVQEAEVLMNPELETSILMDAHYLLRPREAFTSLESVWGPQGVTLEDYKSQFKAIISELFDSKDLKNAEDCLKELSCKHYMHEFVKKLVETVMDKGQSQEFLVIQLLNDAQITGFLLPDQIELGLSRVQSNLGSLVLDVPKAAEILERIKSRLASH